MKASRLLLAGLTAAIVLGAAVGIASAHRFASTESNFRITWSRLTFEGGIGIPVVCAVTLEGTYHSRTISKVAEQLIGYVTRGIIGTCPEGTATILTATLPWHIRYGGEFKEALPNITAIKTRLANTAFLVKRTVPLLGTIECLYEGLANGWLGRETGTGATTRLIPEGSVPLHTQLAGSTTTCPANGSLKGEGEVFVLGSTTRITVTLVQ